MERVHLLFFPFPVVGHINAMLQFATTLIQTYDVKVTLLTTEYRLSQLKKSQAGGGEVEFVGVPDGIPDEEREGPMAGPRMFKAMGMMAGTGAFEKALQDVEARGPRISFIVSDTFVSWTQGAADKMGIPRVAFWTSNASAYAIHRHAPSLVAQGLLPLKDTHAAPLPSAFSDILGTPEPFPAEALPGILRKIDPSDMVFSSLLRLFENDNKSKYVLMNTYHELEPHQLGLLKAGGVPVLAVGPLVPPSILSGSQEEEAPATRARSRSGGRVALVEENMKCLEWLDLQPENSVVYAAFGSVVEMSRESMEAMAGALEASGRRFLWAVRGSGALEEGFLKRTEGRGMVISWAPQLAVLAHAAVGGFLTHAGWNSTLEAIACGVPMVAMPTDFAEHKTVAWLVDVVWRIGVRVDHPTSSHVAGALLRVMEGEEAASFRCNAARMRDSAIHAVSAAGSSVADTNALARALNLLPKT